MADIPPPQYPQAQPAPANSLATMNPLQAVATANYVQNYQNNQRVMAANQAAGEAFQGALNDDGSVDMSKVAATLKGDPRAAYGLPDVTAKMLAQGGAQMGLDTARNKFVTDAFGSLADDPKLTKDKVLSLGVTLARNLKIPAPLINNWLDGLPNGGQALRDKVIQFRNLAIGSAGASTPTDAGLDSEGAPQTGSRGTFNYKTAGGTIPSALPPGEGSLMGSSAERAGALQATATTSPQYRADLANLKTMSKVLDIGGPTVQYEKKLGQLAQRFGLPSTLTPDQLKSAEEFDKISNQIALNQGKALGGTDATRVLSVGSTPSSSMSRYGREGVINLLEGNQDFVDRARDQWLEARNNGVSASKHDQFMHAFGKNFDVRVFQFNRLDRANKQKFIDTLDPSEVPGFEQSYKNAAAHGWVEPLTKGGK